MEDLAPFRPLGEENEHYWLVQRMAKATGVDLVRAWDQGLLTHDDWAAIVTRCRGCRWAEGCDHWLDLPTDADRDLPHSCLNKTRLAKIKATLEESTT
ncbi:DUF6455 family protein [Tropicibacter naphthalenivorans]|uniref:DUF6455 domain-containing protein n=1 Tax=Tropicibacter naphthalenivorans TaxID=441103 RepID=A0A0P1FZ44_9RHOB|nr:DUF6455 family protein [Tropicibacter naphthalenivorans]CUH74685.1 hypothetical protein TRN7648_00028 [Tropicibacter naphthalenivorans]SMC49849.1 hypothetical protein SAMN04488093_101852 [Tropicibacter naphthalenivorans]